MDRKRLLQREITNVRVRYLDKLKVLYFSGKYDLSDYMIVFNIALEQAHFTAEEKAAGYYELFVENLNRPVLTWFSRLKEDFVDSFYGLSTELFIYYSMFI